MFVSVYSNPLWKKDHSIPSDTGSKHTVAPLLELTAGTIIKKGIPWLDCNLPHSLKGKYFWVKEFVKLGYTARKLFICCL